jgi:hypothetical protein
VLALACAGPVTLEAGRFRLRDARASVADLAALDPAWGRSEHPHALLSYRHSAGGRAVWLRQCRGASASARPEAHALLVRLAGAELLREGPAELAGAEAWMIVASAVEAGRPVTWKSVTRVSAGACVDDFVLVATGDLAPLEDGFDRWWSSFEEGAPG